jgi:hypothetical protein
MVQREECSSISLISSPSGVRAAVHHAAMSVQETAQLARRNAERERDRSMFLVACPLPYLPTNGGR